MYHQNCYPCIAYMQRSFSYFPIRINVLNFLLLCIHNPLLQHTRYAFYNILPLSPFQEKKLKELHDRVGCLPPYLLDKHLHVILLTSSERTAGDCWMQGLVHWHYVECHYIPDGWFVVNTIPSLSFNYKFFLIIIMYMIITQCTEIIPSPLITSYNIIITNLCLTVAVCLLLIVEKTKHFKINISVFQQH